MPARRPLFALLRSLPSLVLAAGAALIAAGSLVYFGDELPPFLIEKLPLPHEDLWLFAVRVHVVSAILALPACLVLSWPALLRRARPLHRWLGRATGALVLAGAVPSGLYLALFAKGGLGSTLGFWLSGVITFVAMAQAIRTARAGDVAEHRRFARHVLAQLSVAVTSRAMLFAFDAFAYDATAAYLVSLWVPVVGSALLVEAARRRARRRNHSGRDHETARDPRHPVRNLPGLGVAAR